MSSTKQISGRVELDPSKLLGFSQLTKVASTQGGADALFNKRGGEPSSPQLDFIDALLNKRGTELTSPRMQRIADSMFNKRGSESDLPARSGK
jgi:hypothetical protein